MAKPSIPPPATAEIPVGDAWRSTLRPPVFGSLVLAAVFLLYAAPVKETPTLFDHAPWMNDPFDTVTSFMMFFVPLIALICVPRVLLCRRVEPLPAARIRDVLRGCRVVLAGIAATLVSEWTSVVIRDNRAQWNDATWVQIALLAVMSIWTVGTAVMVRRTGLPQVPQAGPSGLPADGLGDLLALVARQSDRIGLGSRAPARWVDPVNASVSRVVRRHPLLSAFAACALFGIGVGANQGRREGYVVSVTVVVSLLLTAGMFGMLVAAGRYLGLVRSSAPSHGAHRRAIDAAVMTCIGVLVPFALRYHLWWVVGSTNAEAGPAQLLALLGISAAGIFTVAYGAESALRVHSRTSRSGR